MTKDEALKRSLEQLEFFDRSSHQHGYVWQKHLITAIKEALAGPEQTHSQNPKFTMDEWAAHARKHQWRFDEEPVTGVTTLAQQEHPEQMARLGWQYVECPACGSEGARAFPKPEPVATVIEELEHDGQGWCSKVRWLYNPVPVGETLSWEQPK